MKNQIRKCEVIELDDEVMKKIVGGDGDGENEPPPPPPPDPDIN